MAFNRHLVDQMLTPDQQRALGDIYSKYGTLDVDYDNLPEEGPDTATAPGMPIASSAGAAARADQKLREQDSAGKIKAQLTTYFKNQSKTPVVTVEDVEKGAAEGGLIEAEGYADGGEVCSHCGRKNYEDGGEVEGPGTGTSDSVKARLSDGEFVFTAKAVEQIGADNLMAIMKEAEKQYDKRTSESEARSLFGKMLRK